MLQESQWWRKDGTRREERLAVIQIYLMTRIGAPPLNGYTARGKTLHGGNLMDAECSKSLSSPDTGHQAPVSQSPVNQAWSTRHRAKNHWSTNDQSPVTGHPVTSHWLSSHQSSSDYTEQLIARHQSPVIQSLSIQSLVTSHQSTYQASVITHQKSDKDDPVNKGNRSSEQLFPSDPQNSYASKRVLLSVEPDFSRMSDPCNHSSTEQYLGFRQ